MSRPAKYLTHGDREYRRVKIKLALRAGGSIAEVAATFGLTRRYIAQLAQDCGLSSPPGRPKGSRAWRQCPAHLAETYDYFIRCKRIPAAVVRQVLEAA